MAEINQYRQELRDKIIAYAMAEFFKRGVKAVKMDNKELTAFLKAYASGMISLPEGMLQEDSTENEETEGYEDEA